MFPDGAFPIRRKKTRSVFVCLFHFWTRCRLFFLKRVKAINSIISQSSSRVHLPLCLDKEPEQSNKGGKIFNHMIKQPAKV